MNIITQVEADKLSLKYKDHEALNTYNFIGRVCGTLPMTQPNGSIGIVSDDAFNASFEKVFTAFKNKGLLKLEEREEVKNLTVWRSASHFQRT